MRRHPIQDLRRAARLARTSSEPPNLRDDALRHPLFLTCPRCKRRFVVESIIVHRQTEQLGVHYVHLDCLSRNELLAMLKRLI